MNSNSGPHDREHLDWVFLYALQALPPAEIPIVEARISECAECLKEMEMLRPIIRSFVSWPTDVLRPSESLWVRLAQRIAKETGEPALLTPPRRPEQPAKPEWEEVAPGISVQMLATDTEKNSVSLLVRLEPGTDYPPHCHAGVEELHLLHGELMVDDRKLYPGDFIHAEAGSVDHRVWSETGCTCFLLTSTKDIIL
jgi:quercetin dioxygenase-like cupin family protein